MREIGHATHGLQLTVIRQLLFQGNHIDSLVVLMHLQHALEDHLMFELVKKRGARVAHRTEGTALALGQIQLARVAQIFLAVQQPFTGVEQQTTEHALFRFNGMRRRAVQSRLAGLGGRAARLHQVFRWRFRQGGLIGVNHGPGSKSPLAGS